MAKIVIEYEGKVEKQAGRSDNARKDYALSKFLECLISDALKPFMEERKASDHRVEETSVTICGHKVTITQEDSQ